MAGAPFFELLSSKFREFHQDEVNVGLHLLTTPLGYMGAACFVYRTTAKSPNTLNLLAALYLVALAGTTPLELLAAAAGILAVIVALTRAADLGLLASLALVVVSYVAQDAAHYLTGEVSYLASYTEGVSAENATEWLSTFVEHTVYLLPLALDAAVAHTPDGLSAVRYTMASGLLAGLWEHVWVLLPLLLWVAGNFAIDSDSGPFPWSFAKRRVIFCNLDTVDRRADLATLRKWATDQSPSRDMTTHWWYSDLDKASAACFDRVAEAKQVYDAFRKKFSSACYNVDVIKGMNEVYVSGPQAAGTSDEVFTTEHVDGPWALVPFVSTYRCIIGLDACGTYTTRFPQAVMEKTCRTGDVLAFDYNREVHYIVGRSEAKQEQKGLPKDLGGDGLRIVLKVHYVMYPRLLWPLGKLAALLSTLYNICFRGLFLFSLAPSSPLTRFAAANVVFFTKLYKLAISVGLHNLLYVAALAAAAARLGDYTVFLVGTSFVHYLRYISTYYCRTDVNYGTFKYDVLFHKTIALAQLAFHYCQAAREDYYYGGGGGGTSPLVAVASVAMIASGYAVSVLATRQLGIDRTYFGYELGFCPPGGRVTTGFPYGSVPHPMILGQVFALLGAYLLPAFREAWPWLVPAHCVLYLLHCGQEHFDVHAGRGKVKLA